jgi:hypothetical protein
MLWKAKSGQIWITMQTHRNVSAICSLKDLPAVIITGSGKPDEDMLTHARDEEVAFFQLRIHVLILVVNYITF